MNEAAKGGRTHKQRWLFSLLTIGLLPQMEALESGTGDGWQEAERRWIAFYRAKGAALVNGTEGGEGVVGWGTPEQLSMRGKRAQAGMSAEERSANAKKRAAKIPPERRSAIAKRRQAALGDERRSEIATQREGRFTPEARQERSDMRRAQMLNRTPEQREAMAEKWTAEQRSAASKRMHADRTPEQRCASIKNALDALAKLTPEQLSARAKTRWANKRRADALSQSAASCCSDAAS